jgi:hypothetical protein
MSRLGSLIVAQLLMIVASGAVADGSCEQWRWIQPRPHGNSIIDLAYGNGRFIALGDYGIMLSSSDGKEWSPGRRIASVSCLTWTGDLFAAAGDIGAIFTSPDGETWTEQTTVRYGFVHSSRPATISTGLHRSVS